MTVQWAIILLVAVALAGAPGSVGAARPVFGGELAAKLAAPHPGSHDLLYSAPDIPDSDLEEFDLLDVLNREYDSPFGSYGHGGYGYGYYCYGCRGGYGGYGDTPPEDSNAAYENLLQRDADLRVRHLAHDRMYDLRREYDVYGMEASWAADEQRMTRRVMRAEATHRQHLDSDLASDLALLERSRRILGDTEYGEYDDSGTSGEGSARWDDDFPFPFPDSAPRAHGGGCYGGYYGCYGGYGGHGGHGGYGDPFEDLLADPHNLELQEALLEVRQKLRQGDQGGGGGAKVPVGRDVSEMEEEVRRLMQ